ncbi:MAG: SOS response-associated peptidase [Halodesulfurarchaeum sp.]
MCGRTSRYLPQAVIEARFDAESEQPLEPRYNIAPFDDQAVITNDAQDAIRLYEWGFLPEWADDPNSTHRPINARAETVGETPMFRDAFRARRCLVIVDGYYEWQEQDRGPKQPYRITLSGEDPFAMAGLYSRFEENGTTLETTTIITTDASAVVESIHDRMPVILPRESERTWLEADDLDAKASLLSPYSDSDLVAYPVSRAVNDPANDSASVIEEVSLHEEQTQSGLDDFA